MKFAVVEYNSKSGGIWRAQPDKPNYLENPATVIDPTSFGCYVSALRGEHIPLVKIAGAGRLWARLTKKLTGHWPSNYSLSYFARFDVLLCVHQISDAHEIALFVQRLKTEYPKIFIVGVPTQPYGILQPHLETNTQAKQDFVDYLNACDLFLTVVRATQDWYESLTTTPVIYLPQIYPAHFAGKHFRPLEEKDRTIFIAGITDRPNIRQGFRVAKALQREFSNYHINVTRIPGVALDLTDLTGARYQVVPFQPWREHLPWLAHQRLTINTDYTFTRGRVQVDSAAVGTPSLGGNSDGQADLFPDLVSTPQTPDQELVALGRRLLTDAHYYRHVTTRAQQKLPKYDYEESAARFMMLVKSHQS